MEDSVFDAGVVVLAVAVLALLYSGVPFMLQRPLRERGTHTTAWEVGRTVPRDGKIDVQYAYDGGDGEPQRTKWMRGLSMQPQGAPSVIYDPENPKRSEFVSLMPENVKRKRVYLGCLLAVAAVSLILVCVSAQA
ncbi:hypothetical protein [Streptomyces sp. NPDC059398]|uniref:hypothetical protein n=1 Tax=Streptomyces sp. NPDC059398 TaxID=3346820 RepID=UPI0036A13781